MAHVPPDDAPSRPDPPGATSGEAPEGASGSASGAASAEASAPGASDAQKDPSASSEASSGTSFSTSSSTSASLLGSFTAFETVLLAGGFVLFLVLLYKMEFPGGDDSFLSPILIAGAGAILLWPLRTHRSVRTLMLTGGFLLLVWFMDKVSPILIPFVLVYLVAYFLNPVVESLNARFSVQRWMSSLAATLVVIGGLVAFVLIVAPNIANQAEALANRAVNGMESARRWLETTTLLDNLEDAGFVSREDALGQLTQLIQNQLGQLPDAARQLAQSIGSLLSVVTVIALIPVILFYMLKDYPHIRDTIFDLFPTFGGRRDYLVDACDIVGNYLRGQLIISAISAINVSFWLFVGGVPFWLLLGLLSGLLNFIPNLGAIITMFIGVVIAFLFGGWVKVLVVVAVLLGQGLLEQSVLTPNIMSYQVGLHPIVVLLSLLIFGSFLGLFGLLIAVPVTAILVTAYKAYREELTLDLNDYSISAASESGP